ncbi:MAG: AAA family ATPase [Symbiobacteriia bacterium]
MDLFDYARQQASRSEGPLAARMRPRTLDEVVGQQAIVGPGKLLRRAIEADQISSIILYGPPGTGKTTLAKVVAGATRRHFEQLNAVSSGVAELRKLIDDARQRQGMYGKGTILFVDEIHRWSKSQQDALLPHVEEGLITLIGATTENPYFEVNPALVSRSRVFRLEPLSDADVATLLRQALTDQERGLGGTPAELEPDAAFHLVRVAGGDARAALNALELAVKTTPPGPDGLRHITLTVAEESIQKRAIRYDKGGDNHYDTISAFIKSMRGSDPDAALYWLARMIYGGEDPLFIARRIVICAAEDVGLADPQALVVAGTAMLAVERLGLPEGRIPLAEAAVYVATAPKSNAAYLGIDAALAAVEQQAIAGVPVHLRSASYKGAKELGHGAGYKYAHDFPGHFVPQQYLPDELAGQRFYEPGQEGREKAISERLAQLQARREAGR